MKDIKLIIFDFDGTLVDTAPDLIRTTNSFLKAKGYAPLQDELIRSEIGMGLKNLIFETFPEAEEDPDHLVEIEREFLEFYEREFLVSPTPFDGLLTFLNNWRHKIAIVSNKRARFIHPILKKLELHKRPWSAVIGGDTFPVMKPHPLPFEAALKAAEVTPQQTLIIGDGEPDILGAKNIGAHCAAVSFGYSPLADLMKLGADFSISNYYELIDRLFPLV